MTLPSVTCLMPTRGRPEFVRRSIEMFRRQDYEQKHLLILPDSRHDLPRESLMGRGVSHVVVPGSIGAKLNVGAFVGRGSTLLMRWDDDDWQAPNRISQQVAHWQIGRWPVIGFSSLVFYRPGDPHGWEYFGDGDAALGTSLTFTTVWALTHPFPDSSLGEDGEFVREARGNYSTLSGMRSIVACIHGANVANYIPPDEEPLALAMGRPADNWRKVPFSDFASTVRG